ncbi:hypothetical protein L195_g055608, partial [Trifolium pratense]
MIKWVPPKPHYVKLNTDGANKDNHKAGCGGVIRGNQDCVGWVDDPIFIWWLKIIGGAWDTRRKFCGPTMARAAHAQTGRVGEKKYAEREAVAGHVGS